MRYGHHLSGSRRSKFYRVFIADICTGVSSVPAVFHSALCGDGTDSDKDHEQKVDRGKVAGSGVIYRQ